MATQLQFMEDVLEREFRQFHHAHPEVYDAIVDLARQWRRRGRDHWSMNGIFAVLRFQSRVGDRTGDGFVLNNNHRSFYARLVMANEPDLDGIFRLREQRHKLVDAA